MATQILWLFRLLGFFALSAVCSASLAGDLTVYAAASLTNVLSELAQAYEAKHSVKVRFSFASSGTLAKQIEAGAPADVFISADNQWMDYLEGKGKIDAASRFNLAGNRLVLIAPKGKAMMVTIEKGFPFGDAFNGKLCTGQTESVPVGIYAKQALAALGWWEDVKDRIVGADDVRGALDLVGRGECVGIVYATDALVSGKVETVATFPDNLHSPIVYPAARVQSSSEAKAFLEYLQNSQAAFARYGFKLPG